MTPFRKRKKAVVTAGRHAGRRVLILGPGPWRASRSASFLDSDWDSTPCVFPDSYLQLEADQP